MMHPYYTYAIIHTPPDDALFRLGTGLYDQPLCLIHAQGTGLSVVVSAWPATDRIPASTDIPRILEHEEIIERIMLLTTVLPVRYGTVMAGKTQIEGYLHRRRETLLADLAHVAGRVEMGVRVFWHPPEISVEKTATTATKPGTQYLQNLAHTHSQSERVRSEAQKLAVELCEQLKSLAVAVRCQNLLTKRLLLSAACLIQQEDQVRFQDETLSLRNLYTEFRFSISGPWPAYHFITLEENHINHDSIKIFP